MTLVLHAHPLSSFCWKVLIAFYENEVDFELRHLDLADEKAREAFRALWPIGKMPVLEDGGRTIVESSIIIEHVGIHHPGPVPLLPTDPADALPVRMLDRIFDQYVMRPIQDVVEERLREKERREPDRIRAAKERLAVGIAWAGRELDGRDWAAGDTFSLADCAAAPALYYASKVLPLDDQPALTAYLDRMRQRESFVRVLAEAQPYAHFFPSED